MKRGTILTAILLALAIAGISFAGQLELDLSADTQPAFLGKSIGSLYADFVDQKEAGGIASDADCGNRRSDNAPPNREGTGKKNLERPARGSRVNAVLAHNSITPGAGPASCYVCHEDASQEMFDRLLRAQTASAPETIAGFGEGESEKEFKGVETFCAYSPYAKGSCYNCHVKSTAAISGPPSIKDLDCQICHHDET